MEVKGTGTANQCPTIDGGVDGFAVKPGKYNAKKFCLEPTSVTVKAEGVSKNSAPDFQKTKLMTRLTYTLDEIEGPLEVSSDGSIKFEEKDEIDYATVTVQLPGGERVPFLFTIKQLVASGKPESFGGEFLVPSYRSSSFPDPKGRGGSTGYDNAVALPAGGRGDKEELSKENVKNVAASTGKITLSVTSSKEILRETVRILRYNLSGFMAIGAVLICPVSAVLLSNVLVDPSIVKRLAIGTVLIWKRIFSTYLLVCTVIVGCLTSFFVLLIGVSSLLSVIGFPPSSVAYTAIIIGLFFSVFFANAIIICEPDTGEVIGVFESIQPSDNFATGCIFEYDEAHPEGSGIGFKEEDTPNFTVRDPPNSPLASP